MVFGGQFPGHRRLLDATNSGKSTGPIPPGAKEWRTQAVTLASSSSVENPLDEDVDPMVKP
jgi:hypothetical protein